MLDAIQIIEKKRDGLALCAEEIAFMVSGYAEDRIPDYQAAAWAMAIYFRGMTAQETVDLTMAMVRSGSTIDLSPIGSTVVDKHSTGGVGDKTTLVVAPMVSAVGLPVAKMSGRGLGFSGGTLDKLESIPGYRTRLSMAEFYDVVQKSGIAVIGQTKDLAPADGLMYALRDVTATVDSPPLIASSIMSKKIAAGCQALALDVKFGSGAFNPTPERAYELARTMAELGRLSGVRTTALITDMNEPLGRRVGNGLEVAEALDVLSDA